MVKTIEYKIKIIVRYIVITGYIFAAILGATYLFMIGLAGYHYILLALLPDPSNHFIFMYFGGFTSVYLFYGGVVAIGFKNLRSILGRRKK